jgi:hypothetical protein
MDTVKMTEEIPKIKQWLEQNNVDSICVDVIYDDIVKVSLSKRANERLWTIQHMFCTFDMELDYPLVYLEDMAKELNKGINKEASK